MISRLLPRPGSVVSQTFANKVLEHHNRSAKGSNGVSTVHRSFALLRMTGHILSCDFLGQHTRTCRQNSVWWTCWAGEAPALRALFCYALYSINSPRWNSWPDLRVYFSGTAKYPLR